ncbi:MAG TPA: hypothetical protein VLY04_09405 [Bryobacteraceae bacterium]|nr:hypothetical protein [Bryobacteraceae bacterium]
MISAIVRELLLPLLIFLLLRMLVRSIVAGYRSSSRPGPARRQPPPVHSGGVLKKDPVCGTYVSADSSITRTINGQVVHFCSRECSEKYR